jgi:hypothetical protein
MHKNLLHLLLVGVTLILAGCSLPTGIAPGPRVWSDDPLDGAYLPLAPVVVRSRASWETGTASAAACLETLEFCLSSSSCFNSCSSALPARSSPYSKPANAELGSQR